MNEPFTTEEQISLLQSLIDSKRARVAEDGLSIERVLLDFWAPVWTKDPEGFDTPWGRGKLTLEGQELMYRKAISEGRFRRVRSKTVSFLG